MTDIVFDKTGTLTCGVMTVVGEDYKDMHVAQVKGILLSLLQDVRHPVAAAVLRHLQCDGASLEKIIEPTTVVDVTSVPGSGVYGTCVESNLEVRAGSPEWLNIEVDNTACTLLCVTIGKQLCATFKLKDRLRHTSDVVIAKLHAQGIETHMISGDGQGAVDDIAHSLNIPKRNTKSRCKPEGKMNYVKDLQAPGKVVMFVGDGTNDSVALKQANIGVHINQGSSDVAKSAADVVLMTARLHDILILLDISRAAYRRIVLNFVWSAFYNVSAVLLAAGVFTKAMKNARIRPEWAGLGELVSVLPVVLIAFQMRWRDYGRGYRAIEYEYLRMEDQVQECKVVVRRTGERMSESSVEYEDKECFSGPPKSRKEVARKDMSTVMEHPATTMSDQQQVTPTFTTEMPQIDGAAEFPTREFLSALLRREDSESDQQAFIRTLTQERRENSEGHDIVGIDGAADPKPGS